MKVRTILKAAAALKHEGPVELVIVEGVVRNNNAWRDFVVGGEFLEHKWKYITSQIPNGSHVRIVIQVNQ